MKSSKNLIEQLKSLPHFDKAAIYQLSQQYGLANTTVDTYICRALKRKDIIQLKKGLYISADFFNKNRSDISYPFYIANIIRTPSYVSSWTALQYYNLTTEVIHSITSVTSKITRNYKTKVGNFSYQSIKKELFLDFSLVSGKPALSAGGFDFFIASPAKALFDLLYFKTHQFRGVRLDTVKSLIDELRIDIDEMDKEERGKFYTMINKYIHNE